MGSDPNAPTNLARLILFYRSLPHPNVGEDREALLLVQVGISLEVVASVHHQLEQDWQRFVELGLKRSFVAS